MNRRSVAVIAALSGAGILAVSLMLFNPGVPDGRPENRWPREKRNSGRYAHFLRILRDPATGRIPDGIREKELQMARSLPTREQMAKVRPDQLTNQLAWKEAGPNDVGGRTRALAVDPRNASVVLAGGVNGGLWRSDNKGTSWSMRTEPGENLSVSSLAQDPLNRNTWYYAMGEYAGSDSDRGSVAWFFGSGIFKSTDNGLTWSFKKFASTKFPVQWDSDYHYTSAIAVSPVNSWVFLTSHGGGLLRSKDGGDSFLGVYGNGLDDHEWVELDIASTGRIALGLSAGGNEVPATQPGIYISDNNGDSFRSISPAGFPADAGRTLVKFAPSDPNILYAVVNAGPVTEDRDSVLFYKFTQSAGNWTAENRSANLPRLGGAAGDMLTQYNYNMVLAVKPDDPNFVLIGFTNLYRSKDGFATRATSKLENWVGGYDNQEDGYGLYPAHHPDQHALVFDPANPNKAWSGHDGGLSYTEDIRATPVVWTSKNNGYNVTQFYTVAQRSTANNPDLVGGTQDNGSPYFTFNGTTTSASEDVSSGDGSYAHFGSRYLYVSSQGGWVDQYELNSGIWAYQVSPQAATDQLFVHPFAVRPDADQEMAYPDGRSLWINKNLSASNKQSGWQKFTPTSSQLGTSFMFTAVAYNPSSPAIIYLTAYSEAGNARFITFNTSTNTFTNSVSIASGSTGWYAHSISVDPGNGSELMVAVSNYNVQSIFRSTNGGQNFTGIEGNLAGTTADPGPSVRSVLIMRRPDNVLEYYAGTSTGLYSTLTPNGASTVWVREGGSMLGTAIVEALAGRSSDGRIAAATHGRGIFTGVAGAATSSEEETAPRSLKLLGNYPNPFNPETRIAFELPRAARLTLEVYDMNGRLTARISDLPFESGRQEWMFSGAGLASGNYLYRITGAGTILTGKMTLLK